jgi:hypothetical protein
MEDTQMKVTGFTLMGGAYKGGFRYSGATIIKLEDGSTRYFEETTSLDSAIATLKAEGFSTADFEYSLEHWVKTGTWQAVS